MPILRWFYWLISTTTTSRVCVRISGISISNTQWREFNGDEWSLEHLATLFEYFGINLWNVFTIFTLHNKEFNTYTARWASNLSFYYVFVCHQDLRTLLRHASTVDFYLDRFLPPTLSMGFKSSFWRIWLPPSFDIVHDFSRCKLLGSYEPSSPALRNRLCLVNVGKREKKVSKQVHNIMYSIYVLQEPGVPISCSICALLCSLHFCNLLNDEFIRYQFYGTLIIIFHFPLAVNSVSLFC